jgi:hypothetical protein
MVASRWLSWPSPTCCDALHGRRCHTGVTPSGAGCIRERGALSLMIVILFVALIALAGIVVDGGAKLDAAENADALAQEAARAGAALDVSRAYGSGSFVVDPQRAVTAATGYLTAARSHGYRIRRFSVAMVGNNQISVTVTIIQPTTFLSVIGVNSFSCTGTAVASLVTGVAGGGS